MSTHYVSIRELADEFGIHHTNARRYVRKLGLKPEKRRYAGSRSAQDVLTSEDADYVRKKRREEGLDGSLGEPLQDTGVFYVIQVAPELDSSRLKLGYADAIEARLSQHRTAAPTAKLVKTWPCRRSWEGTAIDCLTREGCRLILNEVYECADIDQLLARGEAFFGVLPQPEARPELSPHSPRNT